MVSDAAKHENEQRHEQKDNPGALQKFRAGNDHCRDTGRDGSDSVDDQFFTPVQSFFHQPAPDHPRLREREGDEDANRIQRNQRVGLAFEDDKEQAGEKPENHDSV